MSNTRTADVIVIGSGLTGNSCAYYCAKEGLSVIVLDEDVIGNGASSRNGGGVRAFFRNPLEMPLAKYAIDYIWPHLSEELGVDIEYKQGGNLRFGIGEDERKKLQKLTDDGNRQGLDVEMMDGQQVREFCPYVSENVTDAAYCHNDGHANPMVTTLAFYRMCRQMGVRYVTGCQVTQLRTFQGRIRKVYTSDGGCYEGEYVIVAAGCATTRIVQTVGVDIPISPVVLEAFVTEAMPPLFDFMMGTANSSFYGHQTAHGSFIFGGGSGLEKFNNHDLEQNPTRQITAPSVVRGIMKYFPQLADLKIIRTWSGWTDHTIDGCAVIGPIDEIPGLYVASGYTGHGFCMGPVTGKILSALIMGKTTCVPWEQLKYNRFKAKQ